jgi:hypothetical protein
MVNKTILARRELIMKSYTLPIFVAIALSANAQDKPRVFVQGKGSENVSSNGSGGGGRHWGAWGSKSTVDSHDESMEVTKNLQQSCPGVIVTINQANADYIVMLNRESKQNRGLLRTNNQIQVANKAGDILGTNATRTVGNASKDACNLIVSDWQTHGRSSAEANTAPCAAARNGSTCGSNSGGRSDDDYTSSLSNSATCPGPRCCRCACDHQRLRC